MKNQIKCCKYICFMLYFSVNQVHSINLLDISLKALFFSAVSAKDTQHPYGLWVKNVTFPIDIGDRPNYNRVRYCPEPGYPEHGYRAKIVCSNPLFYTCLQADFNKALVESCREFEWITRKNRPLWRGIRMHIDFLKCSAPYSEPSESRGTRGPLPRKSTEAHATRCTIRENRCVSEGQIYRTDPAEYHTFKVRQLCACDEGYLPICPKEMKAKFVNNIAGDDSCYRDMLPSNTAIDSNDVITKDEIMNSPLIHIDGNIEAQQLVVIEELYNIRQESTLPPLILIAGGVPFLIIIPLCLLRYSVADDDTHETNEENKKTFTAMYTDEHGSKITFECTAKVSNIEGRLELEGLSHADTQISEDSLFQSILSRWNGSSGRGNRSDNISVVSKKLLAIQPAEEEDLCDYMSGACSIKDINTAETNAPKIKRKSYKNTANKKKDRKNNRGLLCFNRKKGNKDFTKRHTKIENKKHADDTETQEQEENYLPINTRQIISKYEDMQKSSVVSKKLLAIQSEDEEELCDSMRGACSIKDIKTGAEEKSYKNAANKKKGRKNNRELLHFNRKKANEDLPINTHQIVNKDEDIQKLSVEKKHQSMSQSDLVSSSKKTRDLISRFEK